MGGGEEEGWEEVRRKRWIASSSCQRGTDGHRKFLPRKMERVNEAEG
jgi:hypothetical protein